MSWIANTIGELYRSRWQIEIFFREIKQLLKIKTFIGTSQNSVMIQIWTALITILILKFLKTMAKFKWHLSNLVAFIRLNIFVKIDLQNWLDNPFEEPPSIAPSSSIQGVLFWITENTPIIPPINYFYLNHKRLGHDWSIIWNIIIIN